MIMKIRKYTLLFFFLLSTVLHAGYKDMVLMPYLYDAASNAPYNEENMELYIGFVTSNIYSDSFICPYTVANKAQCKLVTKNVVNGFTKIELEDMNLDALTTANLSLKVTKKNGSPILGDFTFNSAAFSILSYKTGNVESPEAEMLVPDSKFINSFSSKAPIRVGSFVFSNSRPYLRNRSDLNFSNKFDIDIDENINVYGINELYLNGQKFKDTLPWRVVDNLGGSGLFTNERAAINFPLNSDGTPQIGILEKYQLWVSGNVYASDFYKKDAPFTIFSSWVTVNETVNGKVLENMYFNLTTQNIGFFGYRESVDERQYYNLDEKVSVKGLLLTGDFDSELITSGSLFFKNSMFFGKVMNNAQNTLVWFNYFNSDGQANKISLFSNSKDVSYDNSFSIFNEDLLSKVSLFTEGDNKAQLQVQNNLDVISSTNSLIFDVNSDLGSGDVSIKSKDTGGDLTILGGVNADDFYLNGLPMSMQVAKGEYFLKNPLRTQDGLHKIYYNKGRVSIGSFEIEDSESVLEIGTPLFEDTPDITDSYLDPIMTFTKENKSFSMGVSRKFDDQFFIIEGDKLSNQDGTQIQDPLLSIKKNFLGVGISDAEANLNVSGNLGILIKGDLQFFSDSERLNRTEAFEIPGSVMQFNPYSASFRSGVFLDDDNYYQNVGVYSSGLGYSNQVSGNVSSALGGISNDVSGFYSTSLGGAGNKITHGFSFVGGVGGFVDNHGSFVFSQGGYYPDNIPTKVDTSFSDDNRFRTNASRQFLVGSPVTSPFGSMVGINTNQGTAALNIQGKLFYAPIIEESLAISSQDARELFDVLVDKKFLSNSGELLVKKRVYFPDYFSLDDFPIIVSINSYQVYSDLIATINTNDLSGVITSTNLKEWGVVSTDSWKKLYDVFQYSQSPHFRDDGIGGNLFRVYVSQNITEAAFNVKEKLADDGIFSRANKFYSCSKIGNTWTYNTQQISAGTTENFIEQLIDSVYPVSTYSDGKIASTYSFNLSTSNLKEFMMDSLNIPGLTCDQFASTTIELSDLEKKLYEIDVNNQILFDNQVSCLSNYLSVECRYTFGAYENYLNNSVYPQLMTKIHTYIDQEVLDLDAVVTGTYSISDWTSQYWNGASEVAVETMLESLVNSSILSLRQDNQTDLLNVNYRGNVSVGFLTNDRAELAVEGPLYIYSNKINSLYDNDRSSLVIDNLVDSTLENYDDQLNSLVLSQYKANGITTPNVIIDAYGKVGLGAIPTSSNIALEVFGTVIGSSFQVEGGATLSPEPLKLAFNYETTTPNIYFDEGFLGLGLVSPNEPVSLLHLKYYSGNDPAYPLITYDYNGFDLFQVGERSPEFQGFRLGIPGSLEQMPHLFVSTNSVIGSTLPGFFSSKSGVISGNVGINSGYLAVGTSNFQAESIFFADTMKTTRLFVYQGNGFSKITASSFPWDLNKNTGLIFLNDGTKIGIQTDTPGYDLHVNGDFYFKNNLPANKTTFVVSENLFLDNLVLTPNADITGTDIFLSFDSPGSPAGSNPKLYVEDSLLILEVFGGLKLNQLENLSSGQGQCGDLITIKTVTQLFESQIYNISTSSPPCDSKDQELFFSFNDLYSNTNNYWNYDDTTNLWSIGSNVRVTENMPLFTFKDNFNIKNSVPTVNNAIVFPYYNNDRENPEFYGMNINSDLGYRDGEGGWTFYTDSFSYSFLNYELVIATDNIKDTNLDIKGINIAIETGEKNGVKKTLTNRTSLTGLDVDLSNITIQEEGTDTRGYRFPALFFGDVIISPTKESIDNYRTLSMLKNNTDPSSPTYNYLLSVDGNLESRGMVISNTLIAPRLQVNAGIAKGFNVDKDIASSSPRVGINVVDPQVELDILGDIKSTEVVLNSFESDYINQASNKFLVNQNGFVGFGNTEITDVSNTLFYKLFNEYNQAYPEFIYKNYNLDLNTQDDFTSDMSVLNVEITMDDSNFIGSEEGVVVKGIDLIMTDVNLKSLDETIPTQTGLYVNVVTSDNSFAAVFVSGNVGVGVSEPAVALDINGDIRATGINQEALDPLLSTITNLTLDSVIASVSEIDSLEANQLTVNKLSFEDNVAYDFMYLQDGNLGLSVNSLLKTTTINVTATLNSLDRFLVSDSLVAVTGNINTYIGKDSSIEFDVDYGAYATNLTLNNSLDVGSLIVSNNISNDSSYVENLVIDNQQMRINSTEIEADSYPVAVKLRSQTYSETDVRTWGALGLFSGVTTNSSYVAFNLVPWTFGSNWVGVSKLLDSNWQSGVFLDTTSDLAFYNFESEDTLVSDFTTKGGGFKRPFLYINATGNVFLSPKANDMATNVASFNVSGKSLFSNADGDLSLSSTVKMDSLKVSTINYNQALIFGKSSLQMVSINNSVAFKDTVRFEGVYMSLNAHTVTDYSNFPAYSILNVTDSISLYVASDNTTQQYQLYLNNNKDGEGVSVNLFEDPEGEANYIAMYSSEGKITSSNLMVTDDSNGSLTLYFDNVLTKNRFQVLSYINNDDVFEAEYAAQAINGIIAAPENPQTATRFIRGLSVEAVSGNSTDSFVGIDVSMNVQDVTEIQFQDPIIGNRYSATFMGGPIVITSKNLTNTATGLTGLGDATLSIRSNNRMNEMPSFIVEAPTYKALTVSNNYTLIAGNSTTTMDSIFKIDIDNVQLNDGDSVFRIQGNPSAVYSDFTYLDDSILWTINTELKSATLNARSVKANRLLFDENDLFAFDYDKQFVGFKTNTPEAVFHAVDILSKSVIEKDRKKIQAIVSTNSLEKFTGMAINLKTNPNNKFGSGIVKGLDLNLSQTQLFNFDNSRLYGLYVNVTENAIPTVASFIVATGNVGIGVLEPDFKRTLDINGVLHVKGNLLTPSTNISANVTKAYAGNLTVNSQLDINTNVYMENISANKLTFDRMVNADGNVQEFDLSDHLDTLLNSDSISLNKLTIQKINSEATPILYVSTNLVVNTDNMQGLGNYNTLIDVPKNQSVYMRQLHSNSTTNIESLSSLTSEAINFTSDLKFNSGLKTNLLTSHYYLFHSGSDLNRDLSLFVDSNSLKFKIPGKSSVNLGFADISGLSGDTNYIPYSTIGTLTASDKLIVTDNMVKVSGNVVSSVKIDELTNLDPNGLNQINMFLPYRQPSAIPANSNLNLIGQQIKVENSNAENFEGMGSGITPKYIGLSVSMNNLLTDYYFNDAVADIQKNTAVFEGGIVAIFAENKVPIPTPDVTIFSELYVSNNISRSLMDTADSANKNKYEIHYHKFSDFFVEATQNVGFAVDHFIASSVSSNFYDLGFKRDLDHNDNNSNYLVQVKPTNDVSFETNDLLHITDGSKSLFTVKNNAVFIGAVDETYTSNEANLFQISGETPGDLLVSANGLYIDDGVSLISSNRHTYTDRRAMLDLISSTNVLMKVSSSDSTVYGGVSKNSSRQDVFYLGSEISSIDNVQGSLVGTSSSLSNLNSIYVSKEKSLNTVTFLDNFSYIASVNNTFVAFGTKQGGNNFNSFINEMNLGIIGFSDELNFVANSQEKPILSLSKDKVGIFDSNLSDNSVSLSIESLSQGFLVIPSDNEDIYNFVIFSKSKIGIGVSKNVNVDTLAKLNVNGKLKVTTFALKDDVNTRLKSQDIEVERVYGNSGSESDSLVSFNALITNSDSTFTAYDIQSILNTDVTKNNISAISLKMVTTNELNSVTNYGIYIDMDNLKTLPLQNSNKYSAIFKDSNVVIDLISKSNYKDYFPFDNGCDQNPGHQAAYPACLNNIKYSYPLTVITSRNLNSNNQFVAFTANNSSESNKSSIIFRPAGTKKNDLPLKSSSFQNVIPSEFLLSDPELLQGYLTQINLAINNAGIPVYDEDGLLADAYNFHKSGGSAYTLFNAITGFPSFSDQITKNILAVLENSITQNVFFLEVSNNIKETGEEICVLSNGAYFWDDDFNEAIACVDEDVKETPIDNTRMFPLAISTGMDPFYGEIANIARIGINIATKNNSFENDGIEFNQTFVLGNPDLESTDFDYTDLNIEPGDTWPQSSNLEPFKKENGFHDDLKNYLENTVGLPVNASATINSLYQYFINDFVEKDQHSLTVIKSSGITHRYMSYKTRFNDFRLGQYMPKSDIGESVSEEARLYFSGGPCISTLLKEKEDCSENEDIFSIGRRNPEPLTRLVDGMMQTSYSSHLEWKLDDLNTSSLDIEFRVGYTDSSDMFRSPFIAGGYGSTGYVGIGPLFSTEVRPKSTLHVMDIPKGSGSTNEYVEFFGTTDINRDKFVYISGSQQNRYFDSKQYSRDHIGFTTNLRTAAEEGAGCDGDYRVFQNRNLWSRLKEDGEGNYAVDDTKNLFASSTSGTTKNFPRNVDIASTIDSVSSGITLGNGLDDITGTYDGNPDNSKESVFSCHYYYWIVTEVLGKSVLAAPTSNTAISLANMNYPPPSSLTTQCSTSIEINDWTDFVTKFNLGCYNDLMKANDILNPEKIKLSSEVTRYVPRALVNKPDAASAVTTFDGFNYLNYGDIRNGECKKIDIDKYKALMIESGGDNNVFLSTDDLNKMKPYIQYAELGSSPVLNKQDHPLFWDFDWLSEHTEEKYSNNVQKSDSDVQANSLCEDVNPLRIRRDIDPLAVDTNNYLAEFETKSDEILALHFSTQGIESQEDELDFVGFFSGGSDDLDVVSLGQIEGVGDGEASKRVGIQFSSPAKDYAEYMIKKDPNEKMKAGDIVGVFGGEISLQTQGADTLMVISSAPVIIGNYPGDDVKHLYEIVAFLGQVPVKVIGNVSLGDILIPSGKSDGSAIAISEDKLAKEQLPLIIGRAWEAYTGSDLAYVNTLIGFSFNVDIINRFIEKAHQNVQDEYNSNTELKQTLDEHLQQQQELIDRLEKTLTILEQ
jgi:hypothetical protein